MERWRGNSPCWLWWLGLPQSSRCGCTGQASRRTEEGRMWPDNIKREGSVRGEKKKAGGEREKERWRERKKEVEILVLLARALWNGLFGLAHEAAVADCCCLAVCCSDMQDYTMCSHTVRGRERERWRDRQSEMKDSVGVIIKAWNRWRKIHRTEQKWVLSHCSKWIIMEETSHFFKDKKQQEKKCRLHKSIFQIHFPNKNAGESRGKKHAQGKQADDWVFTVACLQVQKRKKQVKTVPQWKRKQAKSKRKPAKVS